MCRQLPGTGVGLSRFTLGSRRPGQATGTTAGAALAATYLPPPEVLAHYRGNCDTLGAGFLLPTVISAEVSKTPGLLLPMGGGRRGQGKGYGLCHLPKLDPGLTSKEKTSPQKSL